MSTPHLVHVRRSFSLGGAEMRTVRLINTFGEAYRHTIVALDGSFEAAKLITRPEHVRYVHCQATHNPLKSIFLLQDLLRKWRPDLILTYNWGAMDAVAANALFRFAPLIHTEDGFGPEEFRSQLPRRVLWRRLMLRSAYRVVPVSRTLEHIMRDTWRLPERLLQYIPNAVDIDHFTPGPARSGQAPLVIGSVANLTAVKRQSLLIESSAALPEQARLLLAGEGPERVALSELAGSLGVAGRVEFLGRRSDVLSVYRSLDIFALSSITEQMPISVLEAMACGLPILSTDVGDVREMVSPANREWIVPAEKFASALQAMAADPGLRRRLGEENRRHCVERYSHSAMCESYAALYDAAICSGRGSQTRS